jgi:hypothetical protein
MTIMSNAVPVDNVMAVSCEESGIFQQFTYDLPL